MTAAEQQKRAAGKRLARTDRGRKHERQDALRRERDLALREIGDEEAQGRKQLAERSLRQRAGVWSKFRAEMAKLS